MTKVKYVSWYAFTCFAIGAALCAAGEAAVEPSAVMMLAGDWLPNGVGAEDLGLTITATQITVGGGDCSVPYSVIQDANGQGPGPAAIRANRAKDAAQWREVVIELQPKTPRQQSCLQWRVLAFSVRNGRADIAMYSSRAKFESKPGDFDAWGVWLKLNPH